MQSCYFVILLCLLPPFRFCQFTLEYCTVAEYYATNHHNETLSSKEKCLGRTESREGGMKQHGKEKEKKGRGRLHPAKLAIRTLSPSCNV